MRQSRQATAESRARIVDAASHLFRRQGVDATGVAEVMQAAGLTHGGFYRHFYSKEALAAEAVAAAFDERTHSLAPDGSPPDATALRSYIEIYLSKGHIAHPETGCPMAALATEAARAPPDLQAALAKGSERLISLMSGAKTDGVARACALRLFASLVGAVAVARAVGNADMGKEIITAVLLDPEIQALC